MSAKLQRLWRVTNIAKKYDVKRQTLQSAIGRGELKVYKTGCGLPLVDESEMIQWLSENGPAAGNGRPYKKATPPVSDDTLAALLAKAKSDPKLAAKIGEIEREILAIDEKRKESSFSVDD